MPEAGTHLDTGAGADCNRRTVVPKVVQPDSGQSELSMSRSKARKGYGNGDCSVLRQREIHRQGFQNSETLSGIVNSSDGCDVNLSEYYDRNGSRITQDSERLLVDDFLYPLLGSSIESITPQYPFIDATGKGRRIDFAYIGKSNRIALEVNGETYHAEGIIPNDVFDENLFRQNEMLRLGYKLVRFSYHQLQSPAWREVVAHTLRETFGTFAPELLTEYSLSPLPIQKEALDALDFFRRARSWEKGIVVLPTGTGKTVMSALDARRVGPPVLYLVHRLDILAQSIDAFRLAWPDLSVGILTGEQKENELDSDVLFASKDTLRQPEELARFVRDWFRYVIVDEVHHGQSPTYREILDYFRPEFMLGMTATPDRMDRKDIFELFDYNKVFELTVQEAIERGHLVPYTYYGLTDDIDYSKIRYENNRYRVADLEKHLIVPERNESILDAYVDKGQGDKAIGFCVSIKHAERMAELFSTRGIAAAAIHSQSTDREYLVEQFRNDLLQVVFTVDLFNEGVDFPNVRVLLFLRPTESKTVFLQQLGRGLRLALRKDRVRILDFIGNYRRANQIRRYLSTSSETMTERTNGKRSKKVVYTYSTGCEVHFDEAVESLLDRQDALDIGITAEDLREAYFSLTEELGRQPSRADLDESGEFKSALYAQVFGSWTRFLRSVGEYTEASYHYPQGVHLGHILSILKLFGSGAREGTHFDDIYIRLRGNLGEGRLATYRRQVKYKLLAGMELGLITDDRDYPEGIDYELELTPIGRKLFELMRPTLDNLDLVFPSGVDGLPITRMNQSEGYYNAAVREVIQSVDEAGALLSEVLLGMNAVQQMLAFLYHIVRAREVTRNEIYEQFFNAPFVRRFCDQEGIEEATLEASRRRCPFLLNILDACGVIEAGLGEIIVKQLVLTPYLVRSYDREEIEASKERLKALAAGWPDENRIGKEESSILRELYGPTFLTPGYHFADLSIIMET